MPLEINPEPRRRKSQGLRFRRKLSSSDVKDDILRALNAQVRHDPLPYPGWSVGLSGLALSPDDAPRGKGGGVARELRDKLVCQ